MSSSFLLLEDITTVAGPEEGFYNTNGSLQESKVAALSRTYATWHSKWNSDVKWQCQDCWQPPRSSNPKFQHQLIWGRQQLTGVLLHYGPKKAWDPFWGFMCSLLIAFTCEAPFIAGSPLTMRYDSKTGAFRLRYVESPAVAGRGADFGCYWLIARSPSVRAQFRLYVLVLSWFLPSKWIALNQSQSKDHGVAKFLAFEVTEAATSNLITSIFLNERLGHYQSVYILYILELGQHSLVIRPPCRKRFLLLVVAVCSGCGWC